MNERETNPTAAPVANDWSSRGHVQTLVLMVATAVGMYLCYRLALPFLAAFAWARAGSLSVDHPRLFPGQRQRLLPGSGAFLMQKHVELARKL